MEAKFKHLEFIQTTINRMAGNSFILKGWAVTIVGGLLAVSFKELNGLYICVAFVVLLFFWLLDSFYLWQERLFVKLYDEVRVKDEAAIDFSMDTSAHRKGVRWHHCAVSKTALIFYGGLVLGQMLVVAFVTKPAMPPLGTHQAWSVQHQRYLHGRHGFHR
ncbi:hypothetical protein K8R04_03270 [Candidatus Uhrbacteria bacterium]|nr:hypothetical protein [Candidatus Uhrbacteria bacterium]